MGEGPTNIMTRQWLVLIATLAVASTSSSVLAAPLSGSVALQATATVGALTSRVQAIFSSNIVEVEEVQGPLGLPAYCVRFSDPPTHILSLSCNESAFPSSWYQLYQLLEGGYHSVMENLTLVALLDPPTRLPRFHFDLPLRTFSYIWRSGAHHWGTRSLHQSRNTDTAADRSCDSRRGSDRLWDRLP